MKKILVLSLLLISLSSFAFAGTVNLPKTGQTKCYDEYGAEISCAGTGQDGDIQAGVTWPSPRFTVSGDCVMDNLTGLIWTKDANLPNSEKKTWQQALDYVTQLNSNGGLCGYTDWHLPNVNELESLINLGEANTAMWLNTLEFINVKADSYWSSTTYALYKDAAFNISMLDGSLGGGYKSYHYGYVWPVRAVQNNYYPAPIWKTGQTKCYDTLGTEISCTGTGQDSDIQAGVAWPEQRFMDYGDGTVIDSLTGLMWTKDANAPGSAGCNPEDTKTWQEALDYVACLNSNNYLGYTEWRLPNRKELHSLTDFTQYNPALPAGHPFINVYNTYYWVSTTHVTTTSNAYMVYTDSGSVLYGNKPYKEVHVWPVRTAPPTYTISGSITGDVLAGVTINLSGDNTSSTVTDSSGNYSFRGLINGTYTITPSKSGYTFYPASRTVTIEGASQIGMNFTATAVPCVYIISPLSQLFNSNGGTGSVNVTTQSGCSWTVTNNASWITITSGSSGTGNGKVNYSVAANTGSQRTGIITIAEQMFTVTQEGNLTAECSTWTDVIERYNAYVIGEASWDDVITCYNQYTSS